MKHVTASVVMVLLAIIMFSAGCDKSDDKKPTGPVVESRNITGTWMGYLVMDGAGNEASDDSLYTLQITQDATAITAFLKVLPEFGNESSIVLSGAIGDDDMTLNGSWNDADVSVKGSIEDEKSMQITITGVGNDTLIVHLIKIMPPLATASFRNEYKLELSLGKVGRGRSVILVHGMDDNADTWNKMLAYLDDADIDVTNNIWVFEYKWWLNIAINGGEMLSMVEKAQADGDISDAPIIIAHSMGGLVSRTYIAEGGDFYRLVTLGTPHLGSSLATLTWIFDWANQSGVTDLAPGSPFIEALNSNSHEKSQRSRYTLLNGKVGTYSDCKAEVAGHCIIPGYEWHSPKPPANIKAGYAAMEKPNDGMVPQSSSRFYGDDDVHHVDSFEWVDHISLNKNLDVCDWVCDFIKDHQ